MAVVTYEKTQTLVEAMHEKDGEEFAIQHLLRMGYFPVQVGDKPVLGICEVCNRIICDGDDYAADEYGIYMCAEHKPEMEA